MCAVSSCVINVAGSYITCALPYRLIKKPENILLKSVDDDTLITIADFGLARKTPTEYSLKTLCGSPMYMSPEIIRRQSYGTKTDMWSVGVIIFILLGGCEFASFVA